MKNTVNVVFFYREHYFLKFFTRLHRERKVRRKGTRKKEPRRKITACSYHAIRSLRISRLGTFTLDLKDPSRNKNTCRAGIKERKRSCHVCNIRQSASIEKLLGKSILYTCYSTNSGRILLRDDVTGRRGRELYENVDTIFLSATRRWNKVRRNCIAVRCVTASPPWIANETKMKGRNVRETKGEEASFNSSDLSREKKTTIVDLSWCKVPHEK